jgi:hypothetical protein
MKTIHLHRSLCLILLSVLVILGLSSATNKQASASAGTDGLTISSSASSYQVGSTFTVTVTDNGSDSINSVRAYINYDSSHLAEQSVATGSNAGSPLTIPLSSTVDTGSQIQLDVGNLTSPVTGPAVVATITFKVVATGNTTVSADSGSIIYLSSNDINSYSQAASVPLNLTLTSAPSPTCPSGYTGTYPNCVAPPSGGGSSGGSGNSGSSGGSSGSTRSSSSSNKSSTTPPSSKNPSTNPTTTPVINNSSLSLYNINETNVTTNSVTINWQSNLASTSSINYGSSINYTNNLVDNNYVTTHSAILSNLSKGTKYHFEISGKTANNLTDTTSDNTFSTQGFTVTIKIVDNKNKPIAKAQVVVNGKTEITDAMGYVVYQNELSGNTQVKIIDGNQTTTDSINIGQKNTKTNQYLSQTFTLTASRNKVAIIYYFVGLGALLVMAITLYFSRRDWKQEYVEIRYLVLKTFTKIREGIFFSKLPGAMTKMDVENKINMPQIQKPNQVNHIDKDKKI